MPEHRDRKNTWDLRYQTTGKLLPPESFLVNHLSWLKPGSVYDLACGIGGNSIVLSQHGFSVNSVDFSKVALDTLNKTARAGSHSVNTIEMDLTKERSFKSLTKVDNIVVIHYKLENDLLNYIPSLLNNKGLFLYCTFNLRQSEHGKFPTIYCLKPEELVNKSWDLKLLKYDTFKNEKGHQDGYLFQKLS